MKVSWDSGRLKGLFQRYQAVLLVLAVGLALLLWPQGSDGGEEAQAQPEVSASEFQVEALEQRLAAFWQGETDPPEACTRPAPCDK